MTDNEIINALECCKLCSSPEDCEKCPYVECTTKKGCVDEMLTDVLDLIKRQKAEIDKLEKEQNTFVKRFYKDGIKDFAERLKERAYLDVAVSIAQELVVDVRDIDDLVEEITERKEDENE